ncbi:MAG: RNA polymerase sigma factor [Candidatus Zixiibacteriota bacterium]
MTEDVNEYELITDAKKGNRKAYDKLVRIYRDKMFALTYRMTGDREASLDLVQDAFYNAYVNMDRFRGDSSFSSWIYRIASNLTLNFLKRKKTIGFISLTDQPTIEPVYESHDQIANTELAGEIARIISELPPKQKLIFNLRYYDKLPFNEIAKIQGKSESTVKTNYKKAVEKLQRGLKKFR